MRAEKTDIRIKYIELNRDRASESPFCKDIFLYKAVTAHSVTLTYTLQLFDECRELIGEYKADCELESNQQLTSFQLDDFMVRLSRDGRERFNKEADKLHIKMYIPRAEKLYVISDIEDAA